jgi:hypothetical protein
MASATLRWRSVAPDLLRTRSTAAVIHPSALTSLPLLRERTAEDVHVGVPVGVEGRQTHEQDEDHGTRKSERHVVAKKATTQAAAGAPHSATHRVKAAVWTRPWYRSCAKSRYAPALG